LEIKLPIIKRQSLPIRTEHDIVTVRKLTREWAVEAQLSLLKQTKITTAASELARNIFAHAQTGSVHLSLLKDVTQSGLLLTFEDQGPGIANLEQAMTDGYSSKNSLGMGLGGAKRLVDRFEIDSKVGEGTRVSIVVLK
jgi:serine/threonine-protein kinase RsbT